MPFKISIPFFSYRFIRPHLFMCLLAFLACAVFTMLGFWQLHRAQEKQMILTQLEAAQNQPAFIWNEVSGHQKQVQAFERIQIQGQLMPQLLFLENQYLNHALGYHVLSPVALSDGKVVLIDRGFIPREGTRLALPSVQALNLKFDQQVQISGQVYLPSSKALVLGPSIEPIAGDRAVIQSYDFKAIHQFLQKPLHPFIIRLDAEHPLCLQCEWTYVSFKPERHYGYAFQWFSFAFVVFILFVALNLHRHPDKSKSN